MAAFPGRVYVNKDAKNGFADLPALPYVLENKTKGKIWIEDMQSHQIAVIRNCINTQFAVMYNQRIRGLIMINCKNCELQVLDSAVFVTQTCTFINCENCELVFEDVDMRRIELYGSKSCNVILVSSPPLTELSKIYWLESCTDNNMAVAELLSHRIMFGIPFKVLENKPIPNAKDGEHIVSFVDASDALLWEHSSTPFESSQEKLRKLEEIERTPFPFTPVDLEIAYNQEKQEYHDSPDELRTKARAIIEVLKESKHTICYTGAGVSTSAKIPDFRGPTGVWTNRETGKHTKGVDITTVSPTYTHYALTHLVRTHLINFLISSNVDGLHMRSGLSQQLLIEHHGNVYKEVCEKCNASRLLSFETRHIGQHYTGFNCTWCNGKLRDTHVGFGENVNEIDLGLSLFHARKADVSFILGTSMNVQPSVAFQILPKKKPNGKLILVNLQKTPYDELIDIRVFAKTDDFMKIFMEELNETTFDQTTDLLSTWTSLEDATEIQQILTSSGPISLPILVSPKFSKWRLFSRLAEGAALIVLGAAIGFTFQTYFKK